MDGDAAAVLIKTNAGEIFERSDKTGIQKSILTYFNNWKEGTRVVDRDVSSYTREKLTQQLTRLIKQL